MLAIEAENLFFSGFA